VCLVRSDRCFRFVKRRESRTGCLPDRGVEKREHDPALLPQRRVGGGAACGVSCCQRGRETGHFDRTLGGSCLVTHCGRGQLQHPHSGFLNLVSPVQLRPGTIMEPRNPFQHRGFRGFSVWECPDAGSPAQLSDITNVTVLALQMVSVCLIAKLSAPRRE